MTIYKRQGRDYWDGEHTWNGFEWVRPDNIGLSQEEWLDNLADESQAEHETEDE